MKRASSRATTTPASGAATPRPKLLAREHLGRVPSQRRSRAAREALLQAALTLFAERGFEATTVGAIARRARTSTGAPYQYFRSKRQLLLVLMNELLEKLERIDMQPAGARDIRTAIQNVLRAGLATDLAYAGAYRAWREAILSDRRLATLDEQVRAWTTGRLRAVFTLLASLPNARRDVDVTLFAALMDRLFWDLISSPLKSDARLIQTLADTIYCTLLHVPDEHD